MEKAAIQILVLLLALAVHLTICYSLQESEVQTRGKTKEAESVCEEVLKGSGYPCMEYTVQTEDGFLLGLQRIPHGLGNKVQPLMNKHKTPVLLQHGVVLGGDIWFLNLPAQSLGFMLADEGFDVWVANVRGTRWSHGHIALTKHEQQKKNTKKEKNYWDWSWDELAMYDLPAMLEFVYKTTGSKVFYVAHSQGTIMGMAAFSQTKVNSMVAAAALLSPITYLDHITSNFIKYAADHYVDRMVKTMGMRQFNLHNELGVELIDWVCMKEDVDCGNFLTALTGPNCCFNDTRIPQYLEFEPHSTSLKNLVHLAQMIRRGTFGKYDYGYLGNLQHYLRLNPPEYDLSLIPATLPMWIAWGGNDALSDPTDVLHMLKKLRTKPAAMVYLPDYAHLDFVLSVHAKEDLYNSMINFFRSHAELY
jgi:lysosomal acid lipase/cholesteryl ester hydrolase